MPIHGRPEAASIYRQVCPIVHVPYCGIRDSYLPILLDEFTPPCPATSRKLAGPATFPKWPQSEIDVGISVLVRECVQRRRHEWVLAHATGISTAMSRNSPRKWPYCLPSHCLFHLPKRHDDYRQHRECDLYLFHHPVTRPGHNNDITMARHRVLISALSDNHMADLRPWESLDCL